MYGIIISLSIFICLILAEKLIGEDKRSTDTLWKIAPIAIICSILGARLYHVLDFHEYYVAFPQKILDIRTGGLGIYGALFGGFSSISIYLKYKNENIKYWINLSAVVLPLGQAIGRLGNYFNNELYGIPTTLPWGILVNGVAYHPLFIYEAILNSFLFIYLYRQYKSDNKIGTLYYFYVYLAGYGSIRGVLEFLRINPWSMFGLNVAQMISILIILISYVNLYRFRPRRV